MCKIYLNGEELSFNHWTNKVVDLHCRRRHFQDNGPFGSSKSLKLWQSIEPISRSELTFQISYNLGHTKHVKTWRVKFGESPAKFDKVSSTKHSGIQ